jgi:proline iminopeptidase
MEKGPSKPLANDKIETLYPEIEPHDHGLLEVGEGQRLYWEACGNPQGKPALVLHGGPGSGCTAEMRRYFDPAAYRVVLFDQRGCGRSRPHASAALPDLAANTTWHLLADIERLRLHLGLERWLVFGGSWGSTLALLYAECHPQQVTELVLWGVATTRRAEIDWLYRGGVAPLLPEAWARFRAGVPPAERDGDLIEAYHRLLFHSDAAVCARAAADWHAWDFALFSPDPAAQPGLLWLQPAFQLARARLCAHYFRHDAWLEDGLLLKQAGKLAGLPGVMVHGRLDLGSPLVTAWELAQAWPAGELVIVSDAGHSTQHPGMSAALVAATDRFAWHCQTDSDGR